MSKSAVRYNTRRPYSRKLWRTIQAAVGAHPDGVPGPATTAAVKLWQAREGLAQDGKVGPKTLGALGLSRDTDKSKDLVVPARDPVVVSDGPHPMPPMVWRWGYQHAELAPFPYADTQLEEVTSTGSWYAGAIRMVAGRRRTRVLYSRGLDSGITLDTGSFWTPHYWIDTVRDVLEDMTHDLPRLMVWGFGEERTSLLSNQSYLKPYAIRGHRGLDPELAWLFAGSWAIARHPQVVRYTLSRWVEDYVSKGLRTARGLGWSRHLSGPDGGRILMACTRAANSGRQGRIRNFRGATPMKRLERFYLTSKKKGGYGKPKRWQKILAWAQFEGPAPMAFDAARDLNLHATPTRHDGSPVTFEGLA